MYDPDPARPTLRLGINLQQVKARHEERADIRRQIEALLARDCELTMLIETEHKQSQPIPAGKQTMIVVLSEGGAFGRGATDNDFWTPRHMAGSEPLIARSSGHVERLRAAASGEIRDPAESLRHSRVMHEPLYEDDGA